MHHLKMDAGESGLCRDTVMTLLSSQLLSCHPRRVSYLSEEEEGVCVIGWSLQISGLLLSL